MVQISLQNSGGKVVFAAPLGTNGSKIMCHLSVINLCQVWSKKWPN